ncbi:sensor domain-containing protein [Streptomyces sp. NPDC000594]|uniref:sensor histidine kinase n=1 Tax=Streptomyces sp. NPDC000594 TaxID=3154261 RepID=UPI00332426CA
MRPRTAWQAMAQHPLSFLTSPWPWRAMAYLTSGVLAGSIAMAVLLALLAAGLVLLVLVIGAAFLAGVVGWSVVVAAVERRRLLLVDLDPMPASHRTPDGPGARAWVRTRVSEAVTWREVGFTLLSAVSLWWLDALVLGFSFVLPALLIAATDGTTWPWTVFAVLVLLAAPYTVTSWAGARAALTRTILAPRDDELGAELREVRASRVRLIDSFDGERRRIERDLHDGAQQRLVSLGMTLGLMRLDAPPGNQALIDGITEAEQQLSRAHQELRGLIRGLNPPTLADQGLAAAVADNAGRLTVPFTVDLDLPGRLHTKVESHLYFIINEAMTNIARHSGATEAGIHGRYHAEMLVMEISDNGRGGADPEHGSGLTGLADRIAAIDGRMRLSSPPGGPTLLHVEVPCHFA